ncbi:hypothetical protein D3C81_1320060 [compost metagenome]
MVCFAQRLGTTLRRITGIDPARADRIDPDLRPQTHGQGMRERQQAALARRIGFGVGFRLRGAGGGQIDDSATVSAQIRRTVLGQQHRPTKVDRQHPVPVRKAQGFQGGVMRIGDSGIAHQRVKSTELTKHFGHRGLDLGFIGNVHADEPGIVAEHFGRLGAASTIEIGEHHLPAFGDQPGSNAQADPPCRTGHQGDAAVMAAVAH